MERRKAIGWICVTVVAPNVAWSQNPGKTYRLGILANTPAPFLTDPLLAALEVHGWRVGKNLHIESRITAGDPARAPQLARELVEQRVDLLVTLTTGNAVAAKQVTSQVPIVMLGSGYPVEAGLAKSLARPGGNVTGVSVYAGTEIWGKYVSLARELRPDLRALAVLFDYVASDREMQPLLAELRAAARTLNVALHFSRNNSARDLTASLAAVESTSSGAMLVTNGPVHSQQENVARINQFALRRRLPMINDLASNVFLGGGVLAYAPTAREIGERCASMIDRILRGASAGELPIEYPTRFELIVNMKTARALKLNLPATLLSRADRVIN